MGSSTIMIIYLVAFFGIFYFLLIRPQQKRTKELKSMRDNLQMGDEIVTIGGVKGRIRSLKEDEIQLEVGPDKVQLTVMRWAIGS